MPDKNINEVEITSYLNDPKQGIKNIISCMDYHWGTRLDNNNKLDIPNEIVVDPDKVNWFCSITPEISCLGHWQDSGFIIKTYIIKNELNTISLLNKYLGYVPQTVSPPIKDVSIAMYDWFMQIQLNTGFGNATNKKYVIHLHRGFSRHKNSSNVWVGDRWSSAQANLLGVYEKIINYGFKYTYKPTRTDNIYRSEKYRILDNNKIPAKKYLDIYESIEGDVAINFSLDFASTTEYNNLPKNTLNDASQDTFLYRPISGPSELPPGYNLEGEVIYNPGKSSVNLTYNISAAQLKTLKSSGSIITDKIDRSDYTLNWYTKLNGVDNRGIYGNTNQELQQNQKDITYAIQKPSINGTQQPVLYSNRSELLSGSFYLNVADNVVLQNRKGLYGGSVSSVINNNYARTNTSNSILPIAINFIELQFEMSGIDPFGNGYVVISDKANSQNGLKLFFPKKVRLRTKAYFYDTEAKPETLNNFVWSGDFIKFKIDLPLTATETSLPKYTHNKSIIYDFYNPASYSQIYSNNKNNTITNQSASFDTKNTRFYGPGKSISISLLDTPETENRLLGGGRTQTIKYNEYDKPEDSPVFFRGKMLPAFIYNRKKTIDLNAITTINQNPSIEPVPTLNTISLNAYRYLRIGIKTKNQDIFDCKYRITIWEVSGNTVIEKYFDRQDNLKQNSFNYRFIDLMFPDFPGIEVDNQDDPYPRVGTSIDDTERINNVYYGCNRIVRIDIHSLSELNTADFSVQAYAYNSNESALGYDQIRLNPSNGKDTNLKKLSTTSDEFGRKFCLLLHERKPEEETDIIFSNNITKILSISQFVERLNKLHNGLDIKLIPEASEIQSTLLQGQHFNKNNEFKQSPKTIQNFYASVNDIPQAQLTNHTFYYSDIFEGTYLDFPPFIQDFNETSETDTWLTSDTRRPTTASYHLDLISYASMRGHVYGSMNFITNIPRFPSVFSYHHTQLFEASNNKLKGQSTLSTTPDPLFMNDFGFFRTLDPYAHFNYDYGNTQFNKAKLISDLVNGDPFTNSGKYISNVKMLPNKATRLAFGVLREKINNPYIPPIAKYYTYFSAAETRLKNEVTVLLGQNQLSLDPYKDPGSLNTSLDGTMKVLNYNSFSQQVYPFKTNKDNTSFADIYGYTPVLINQNIPSNLNYVIFSETYKLNKPSESLIFSNASVNEDDTWSYYNDFRYILSKIFRNTINNTYGFSPNFSDIYCLGVFNNQSLILQAANLDQISKITNTADLTGPSAIPRYSQLIDGSSLNNTQRSTYFPELLDFDTATLKGVVNKIPSLVVLDIERLLFLYTLKDEKNILYYKLFINQELSERKILFQASDFCNDGSAAISNYNAYYDPNLKLIRMVFMLTSKNINNLFFAEFDYNSGVITPPSIFQHISGKFDINNFKQANLFLDTTSGNFDVILPYQKPAITPYYNIDQKGQVGIFFVNNDGNFFTVNILPLGSTSSQIGISV